MKLSELLEIRDLGKVSKQNIFYILVTLYITSIIYYMREFSLGSQVGEYMYDHSMSVIFAPIYEEILFRGIILIGLCKVFKNKVQIIVWGGILFGIWHLKNFPFQDIGATLHQVVYTLFLGSFLTCLALKYKTIWLGVMIHYVNNIFLAPMSWILLDSLQSLLKSI